ncbi:hypothetical protein Tco_1126905 [Tanacetum coccineum]
MERLIENLCTIWIGRFHLHANPVRFQRESIASFVQPSKAKINSGPVKNSFASVLKSNDHKGSPSSDSSPAIVMDDSCIVDNDLSCSLMGKIKDINALSNIYVIFADEGFDNVNISYLGGFWILIEACCRFPINTSLHNPNHESKKLERERRNEREMRES